MGRDTYERMARNPLKHGKLEKMIEAMPAKEKTID